jgi:hypothetical protein
MFISWYRPYIGPWNPRECCPSCMRARFEASWSNTRTEPPSSGAPSVYVCYIGTRFGVAARRRSVPSGSGSSTIVS